MGLSLIRLRSIIIYLKIVAFFWIYLRQPNLKSILSTWPPRLFYIRPPQTSKQTQTHFRNRTHLPSYSLCSLRIWASSSLNWVTTSSTNSNSSTHRCLSFLLLIQNCPVSPWKRWKRTYYSRDWVSHNWNREMRQKLRRHYKVDILNGGRRRKRKNQLRAERGKSFRIRPHLWNRGKKSRMRWEKSPISKALCQVMK